MEREQILAQRQDEMQSRNDKLNLSKLLAAQDLGSMADDSVAQAAKRKWFNLSRRKTLWCISIIIDILSQVKGY